MQRKIAILGSASSTLDKAPFKDDSWEVWALGPETRRVTRYFEMHDDAMLKPEIRANYAAKGVPVYALHPLKGFQQLPYPLEKVRAFFGQEYFTSSIAYMIALALYEHSQGQPIGEIGLWGVDMLTDEEYGLQRPCVEFYLGVATGMNIAVTIPSNSALLKAGYKYGLQTKPVISGLSVDFLNGRLVEYRKKINHLQHNISAVSGAAQETELLIDYLKHYSRGGAIPGQIETR
jgi:hypothetical protein